LIRREWNALLVGDHVLVHEESDLGLPLVPGRVVEVESASGTNEVGIRIKPFKGRSTVVHPKRLEVHLEELDPERHCWRCDTHARAVGKPAR
jgi:hypothetical protein